MEVVGTGDSGRRVVALTGGGGGYAEVAAVPRANVVAVPDAVTDAQALALLVQGLTAWHLLSHSVRLSPGETVVVNAAAGGVGSLAIQLAKHLGAGRVIAVASTEAKRRLALEYGADVAVGAEAADYAQRIVDANAGQGADIVLDAVGGPMLSAAVDALTWFGRVVTYGDASRSGRSPLEPQRLSDRNVAMAGFWLQPLLKVPGMVVEPLTELLRLVADGRLRPIASSHYRLELAGEAHAEMIARRTTGKVWLRT